MTGDGVVLDASAAVDLIVGSPRADALRPLLRDLTVHSPHVVDGEVLSALARLVRGKSLTAAAAQVGVAELARMPVERHSSVSLLSTAWQLRDNVRVADGLYVALATSLGLPLATFDGRLVKVVQQRRLCDLLVV